MGATVALTATPVEIDFDTATAVLVQNQSATALVAMAVTATDPPAVSATDAILRPMEWGRWTVGGGDKLWAWVVGRDLANAVQLDGQGDDGRGAVRWMDDGA